MSAEILVPINSATADQLSSLYGIGPHLADRIVRYRSERGPFASPTDLAKVEGVSLRLAETLASQIDWAIPVEDVESIPIPRWWELILLGIMGVIFLRLIVVVRIPALRTAIVASSAGSSSAPFWVWIQGSLLAEDFASLAMGLAFLFSWFGKGGVSRRALLVFILGVFLKLLALLSVVVANAVYYQFFSPSGWRPFFANRINLYSALQALGTGLAISPFILAWIRRNSSPLPVVRWAFDIGVLLIGLSAVPIAILLGNSGPLSLLHLGVNACMGAASVSIAIPSLLRREASMFDFACEALIVVLDNVPKPRPSEAHWLTWLNMRLPSAEDQRALQNALNSAYKPPLAGRVLQVLVVGVGGWLVVNALSGIVQWLVGRLLDSFITR